MRLTTLLLLVICAAALAEEPPQPAAPPAAGEPQTTPAAPAAPSPAAPTEPGEAPAWPPALRGGESYGNSLPGLFGGKVYTDDPGDEELPETQDIFQRTRGQERLNFSGYADLGFTFRSVRGASETFKQDQYGKDKLFNQNASLLVTGPLWKWANLNVNAQIEQRSFGFNDTRPVWRVFWEDSHNKITFGDISPTVGDTNEFVPFSRRLTGLEARGELGSRFEYLLFGSQVGGSIRNETFVGDGTPGPYYLTYVPIVDGSAVVVLDGVVQQPGYGDTGDYTLNPSTGELLFNGTRIIAPTSRIEVRYETLSTGGPKDLLVGGQLRYSPSHRWRLGLQYITQLSGSDGGASGPIETRVTDQITVPTPSSGPFTVRPRPIVPGSETVQVNGLLQTRDLDYQISYESGELQFFQILPEGANILVRFSVIEAVDLGSGDRSIFGLDTSYSIGDALNVRLEFAQSKGQAGAGSNPFSFGGSGSGYNYGGYGSGYGGGYGGGYGTDPWGSGGYGSGSGLGGGYGSGYNSGLYNGGSNPGGGVFGNSYRGRTRGRASGPDSVMAGWEALSQRAVRQTSQAGRGGGGQAYKLAVNSRLGDFLFAGQLKSVSDNFSRIDSTGFFQNEKGLALRMQYSSGPRFSISHQFDHYSRPYSVTTDEEEISTRVISDLHLTNLSWRFTPDSLLSLTRNSQSNGGGGSANNLSRDSLQLMHRFSSQLSFTAGLDRATSTTSGVVSGTSGVTNDSNTLAGRAGVSFNSSGGRFGARLDYSFSNTESSSSKNLANSIMGSLNWQPFSWATFQFSHQLSDSRNETIGGRVWNRIPVPGSVEYLLWRMDMQRRQAGVGAFDPTGNGGVATDPLTGEPVTNTNITNNKTQTSTVSLLLTPSSRLSISNNFSHTVTDTGRLAGSTGNNFQTNLHYQLSERIGLGLGYSLQGLKYTDSGDRTDTGTLNLNFDWRLSNHLDMRFDWQTMGTRNGYGPREEGEEDPTLGLDPKTRYASWGLDSRWTLPGNSGHSLFASLRNDKSSGGTQSAFSRMQFQTGMDFRLTTFLGLRLSYDLTSYKNQTDTTDNSYTAHLFNAGLGARF